MLAIRMLCKECNEDMNDIYAELVGALQYIEYRCPACGKVIGLELEEDDDERANAALGGDAPWS